MFPNHCSSRQKYSKEYSESFYVLIIPPVKFHLIKVISKNITLEHILLIIANRTLYAIALEKIRQLFHVLKL
jgi:hypothetical protein